MSLFAIDDAAADAGGVSEEQLLPTRPPLSLTHMCAGVRCVR